jgi:hypothetical protein
VLKASATTCLLENNGWQIAIESLVTPKRRRVFRDLAVVERSEKLKFEDLFVSKPRLKSTLTTRYIMTSMAAALAASLPAPVAPTPAQQSAPKATSVPQRLEGVIDPEAAREVESVKLNSLVSGWDCAALGYVSL